MNYSLEKCVRRIAFATLAMLLLCAGAPTSAATAPPAGGADIVLAIDTSGSMKQTDPQRLRIQAAKMFVSLLGKEDRVAVVGFSGNAVPLSKLAPLTDRASSQVVLDAIDKLGADGKYTNLFEAIAQSHLLINQATKPGNSRQIVLMTDGNMDVGNAEQNTRLTERTLEELAPALTRDGIRLYSIAFTEHSNLPLLRLMAQDTQGHFTLLKDASGTHQVFESIFERAKKPDQLPLNEDSFIVDGSIHELTVVASKYRPDSHIALQTPSGKEIISTTNSPSVRWFSGKQFELITVTNPEPGFWELKFSEGGNKAYIVTDLKLHIEASHTEIEPNGTVRLRAWLERDGKRVKAHELMASSRFSLAVTFPDGHVDERPLLDDGKNSDEGRGDGLFGSLLTFDKEGQYRLDVVVAGETFDRKKGAFLSVQRAHPSEPVLPPVVAEPPHPPAPAPAEPIHAPTPAAEPVHVPAPAHEAPAEHAPPPEAAPPADDAAAAEPESDGGIMPFVLGFLAVNALIGIGVGGFYFLKRRKKKKDDPPPDSVDLSEPPKSASQTAEPPTEGSEL